MQYESLGIAHLSSLVLRLLGLQGSSFKLKKFRANQSRVGFSTMVGYINKVLK